MGKKINEYPDIATTFETGSWMDIDQEISPGVYQSQKIGRGVMQAAFGVFYQVDGTLNENRTVDLDGKTLQFINGQTIHGGGPDLLPAAGPNPIQDVNFNTGNTQWIDLENASSTVQITLSNPIENGIYIIYIKQGANLVQVTWPTSVKWEDGTPLVMTPVDDAQEKVVLQYKKGNFYAQFGTNYA